MQKPPIHARTWCDHSIPNRWPEKVDFKRYPRELFPHTKPIGLITRLIGAVTQPGDLIVALRLPAEARTFSAHARYLKVRERTSFAFAVVSAAAALRFEANVIADARLALGGVALKPWRAREAEQILAGARAEASLFRRAAEAALAEAKPAGDNAFKIELARRIVVRALGLAATGTPEPLPPLPGSPLAASSGVPAHA